MQTTNTTETPPASSGGAEGRQRDLLAFLFLTVVLAPALAIAIVAGFGFIIWIFQILLGPPGPPGG